MEQVQLATTRVSAILTRSLQGGERQVLVLTERGLQPLLGLQPRPGSAKLDGGVIPLSSGGGGGGGGGAGGSGALDGAAALLSLDSSNSLAARASGVRLGPPLALLERAGDSAVTLPYTWTAAAADEDAAARAPLLAIADPGGGGAAGAGSDVYLSTRDVILRMDAAGLVELLAGRRGAPGRQDGPGGAGGTAQVESPLVMAADGSGSVWFSDGRRACVRRAQLATPPASAASRPPAAVTVTTLPYEVPEWSLVHALAYDCVKRVLYVCTPTAVYRASGQALTTAAVTAVTAGQWELVAGSDEKSGCVDGAGREARFGAICDAVADGSGCLYVTDMEGPRGCVVVRHIDPGAGFAVRTLPYAPPGEPSRGARLAILPGGVLCVYEWGGNKLWLLRLGVAPSRPPALPPLPPLATPASPSAAAPTAPMPSRPSVAPLTAPAACASGGATVGEQRDSGLAGLAEDWAAMLGDPWDIADVELAAAGGVTLPAHSQVLIARCEYFRRQLLSRRHASPPASAPGGEAAISAAAAVTAANGRRAVALTDVEPTILKELLRHLYTGAADFPPALLRPLLQLAGRLLLPALAERLRTALQQQLLPGKDPDGHKGQSNGNEEPPAAAGSSGGGGAAGPMVAAAPPQGPAPSRPRPLPGGSSSSAPASAAPTPEPSAPPGAATSQPAAGPGPLLPPVVPGAGSGAGYPVYSPSSQVQGPNGVAAAPGYGTHQQAYCAPPTGYGQPPAAPLPAGYAPPLPAGYAAPLPYGGYGAPAYGAYAGTAYQAQAPAPYGAVYSMQPPAPGYPTGAYGMPPGPPAAYYPPPR